MIDRADLLDRIGDLGIVWLPTERERIEIAAISLVPEPGPA